MSNSTLWSIAISVLVIGWLLYGVIRTGINDSKFRADGRRTEAKILNKQEVGVSGTGNIKYRIEIEFVTEKGVVRTKITRFFTPEELIKMMRKNTVALYYLPDNAKKVYLVPDEMD